MSLPRFSIPTWLLAAALYIGTVAPSHAVPSYARQTGMACAACHTVFPELTVVAYLESI